MWVIIKHDFKKKERIMGKWNDINESMPKYTDDYLVACNIGSMAGGYSEVRCYRYEIFNGNKPHKKWCIPDRFDEIITITHWMELPDLPEVLR